jgi:hypothetical protein
VLRRPVETTKERATLAILETNQHYRDGKIRIVKLEELES